jgi:murein DD-endopeptidase MepM/ murein hydrolase activator NlpD
MFTGRNILLGLVILILIAFTFLGVINPHRKPSKSQIDTLLVAQAIPKDEWIVEVVPPNGSLYGLMEKNGIPLPEIARVTFQFGDFIDVTTIQPGDTLKLKLTDDKQRIMKMSFIQEPTLRHLFTVTPDSLIYKEEQLPVKTVTKLLKGDLSSGTLSNSLKEVGLPPQSAQQIINALETKINFRRNAKAEDEFQVLADLRYFEGKLIPGGKVYYVSYKGKSAGSHELFRYEDPSPKSVLTGLYGPDGKIVRSSGSGVGFPLASMHVRSKFGRRIDPVYGGWAMHQGIDYKAAMGTKTYAVADGTVIAASYSGGWGNQVRIRHPNGLITQHAHLSAIKVRVGQKVSKGQVVGLVGSTGKSTGPHLHFGLMKNGVWINPTNLNMVATRELTVIELKDFHQQKQKILDKLQQYK